MSCETLVTFYFQLRLKSWLHYEREIHQQSSSELA